MPSDRSVQPGDMVRFKGPSCDSDGLWEWFSPTVGVVVSVGDLPPNGDEPGPGAMVMATNGQLYFVPLAQCCSL